MSKREVAELACRILALTFLVLNLHWIVSIPATLGRGIWGLFQNSHVDGALALLFVAISAGFIVLVIWFLWTRSIGLWLMLGSRGIVRLIRRLRGSELQETNEDSRASGPAPVVEAHTDDHAS